MKIAYLAHSKIPSKAANSVHVMKMCQALAKNGHEVKLYVPNNKNQVLEKEVFDFYGVEECFEIVDVSFWNIKGKSTWLGYAISKKVEDFKPDFVLGRSLTGCFFTGRNGYPTFYEAHQPIKDTSKIYEWIFSCAVKRKYFQKLIVITEALKKNYIRETPIKEDKILVAPDGADELELSNIEKKSLGN